MRLTFHSILAAGVALVLASPVSMATSDLAVTKDLAPVNVSPMRQGPTIWKYSRAGHVVLVLGTVRPVLKELEFSQIGVERAVASSGAVLGSEGVLVGEGIGLFQGLRLWPSIRKTKLIGNDKTLADVLSAEDYAVWSELKAQYLPNDRDVEKLRPAYAAWQLYEAALKRSGLDLGSAVAPVVSKFAKQSHVPVVDVRYRLKILDAKQTVRSFDIAPADDIACLRATMQGIEGLVQHAPGISRAWVEGELAELSTQLTSSPRVEPCWSRLTNMAIAREQGINLQQVQHAAWLKGLADVTKTHSIVFTTAPIQELLAQEGVAKALADLGFTPEPMSQGRMATESPASP